MIDATRPAAQPVAQVQSGTGAGVVRRPRRTRPGEILTGLARARRTAALYGAEHPVTGRTLDDVHRVLEEVLATRLSLRFFIHEDIFYVGKTVLLEESLRLGAMLAELREREIGTIEFHTGLESWELRRLAEVVNMSSADLHRLGGAGSLLAAKDVRHIVVAKTRPLLPDEQVEVRVDPRDVYRAGLRVVDDLYFQASRDVPLDLRKASLVVTSLVDIMTEDRAALLGIAALRSYDEDTCHHSVNVAVLSLMMATQLKLERSAIMTVGLAALLHDIGKVRVPHEIVMKTEPLTAEERQLLKRHTLYGAHLLRNLPGVSRLAMVVAFEHHANYNLSGYPEITVKQVPHPLTRMVQIADFYDASTSTTQSERRTMLPHQAIQFILDNAGKVFDPILARVFVQMLGLYPTGSVVELDTGEVAVVTRPSEREAERPVVKVIADGRREPVDPRTVNLEDATDLHIVRALDPSEAPVDVAAHLS
ncbi:MAG: HD-GYP domain-containing protein [Armatimonadota bacterium]